MAIYTVYEVDCWNTHDSIVPKLFETSLNRAKQFFNENKADYEDDDWSLVLAEYDPSDERIDGNAMTNFFPLETTSNY